MLVKIGKNVWLKMATQCIKFIFFFQLFILMPGQLSFFFKPSVIFKTFFFFYLNLNHETSLSAQSDNITVDVHSAFRLQTLHHGVDADVRTCPANSSTTQFTRRSSVWFNLNTKLHLGRSCPTGLGLGVYCLYKECKCMSLWNCDGLRSFLFVLNY